MENLLSWPHLAAGESGKYHLYCCSDSEETFVMMQEWRTGWMPGDSQLAPQFAPTDSFMLCAVLGHSVVSNSSATPWAIVHQAPLSVGFSRKEYWSILHNGGLLHCRQILYRLSHQGSPGILEWVAYSFSRGSSQTRNPTGVSCIAGGLFTSWATGEAQFLPELLCNVEKALWTQNF